MTPPEDKAPDMPERKRVFEKMFSHLDLSSIGGKNYTSKRTNNHWRGFEAAWNIRDVAPDTRPIQSPDQGAVEVFAWAREWEGDDSDLGNYIIEAGEDKPDDTDRWFPLYTEQALTRPPLDLAGLKRECIDMFKTNWADVAIERTLDHLQAIRPDLFGGK